MQDRRDLDFREVMSKLDSIVDEDMGRVVDEERALREVTASVVEDMRNELGFTGARVYRKDGKEHYRLIAAFPEHPGDNRGLRVDADYEPIALALANRVVFMKRDDPRTDPALETRLGVEEFAAIEIGAERYVVAFDTAEEVHEEDILQAIWVLRHAINDKLRSERLADVLDEARRIQTSLLPRRVPRFPPFEMAARTEPVDVVGGDFYDFISMSNKSLGVAIADSSGHGLPAALQVRDVRMGLRMGLSRDFKIVRTVERMNHIIHHGTLTRRFVSMFYGELEANGLFIYVNAGHPAPLYVDHKGRDRELQAGGPVLGPLPDASYERGFVNLRPGSTLVMVTDGILEAHGGADGEEEFGLDRLRQVTLQHQHSSAADLTDAIFDAVDEFDEGRPQEDDRTVVVVKHPSKGR